MRVISQNWDIDVEYKDFSFKIRNAKECSDLTQEKLSIRGYSDDYYIIFADHDVNSYIMAGYSTKEKACDVLKSMSEIYKRYIIITKDGNMQITDGLTYDLDKPFEKFEIKEFETSSFVFPKEEEVEV